jgi:hypothetical protein
VACLKASSQFPRSLPWRSFAKCCVLFTLHLPSAGHEQSPPSRAWRAQRPTELSETWPSASVPSCGNSRLIHHGRVAKTLFPGRGPSVHSACWSKCIHLERKSQETTGDGLGDLEESPAFFLEEESSPGCHTMQMVPWFSFSEYIWVTFISLNVYIPSLCTLKVSFPWPLETDFLSLIRNISLLSP